MDPFHFTEIPEFYHNRNGNDNVICAKLREQARYQKSIKVANFYDEKFFL